MNFLSSIAISQEMWICLMSMKILTFKMEAFTEIMQIQGLFIEQNLGD